MKILVCTEHEVDLPRTQPTFTLTKANYIIGAITTDISILGTGNFSNSVQLFLKC